MVFNVLVGNLRMCSIPTGKHVRAQGLFSVRVATSWALLLVAGWFHYPYRQCILRSVHP